MFTSGVNAVSKAVQPVMSEASVTERFTRLFERVALQHGLSLYQAPSRDNVIKLAAMLSEQMSRASYFSANSLGTSGIRWESTWSMLKARSQFSGTMMPVKHEQVASIAEKKWQDVVVREPVSRQSVEGKADYTPMIRDVAGKYGLDSALIHSVIAVESDFHADAVSPVGAQGLMQLMPATAAELGVTDPFDAKQNIEAGSRYLSQLLERYHGELPLALAAYNWGMGNVERHPERMPEETRQYIARVMSKMHEAEVA